MRGRASGYPALADEPELEEKIGKQIDELRSVGIDATFLIRTGNKSVATLIAEAADEVDADLIVVATHGAGGLTAALMGSVARALCHTAKTPLLVIPPVQKPEQPAAATEDRLAAV
jgi:nucleotide-binding universal stress UspA family protein